MHGICATMTIQMGTTMPLKMTNIIDSGSDDISEWDNSFLQVPKPNEKVWLCLDRAK